MFGGAWSSKRSWEASRFEFGIWFFKKIFFIFFKIFLYKYISKNINFKKFFKKIKNP
jgi:hypothetical protein